MEQPHLSAPKFAALRESVGGLWRTAQDHPFVHALGDGGLGQDRFVFYLKQDYIYLQSYARAISIAAAKSPGLTLLTEFTALAHETLHVEMQLHREYCAGFGISTIELDKVEARPICQAYSDFCIATAATGGCAELLAALIPCGVGYAEIGLRLKPRAAAPGHCYGRWINIYAGAEYQQYAHWLTKVYDRLVADSSPAAAARLQQLFALGCRYEWMFWEMAWTMADWPAPHITNGAM